MSAKNIFLLLAVAGTLIPIYFFLPFFLSDEITAANFLGQISESPVAAFFAWDVVISLLVTWGLVMTEGQRLKMKNLWVYLIFGLLVGVSLALPAFLYQREIILEKRLGQARAGKSRASLN